MWQRWRSRPAARISTVIGEQAEIHGDLHFAGGLHIDGRVVGDVLCGDDPDALLTISEHGEVVGTVRAPQLVLNGTVDGDLYVDRLELAARARITGDAHYGVLEMAVGATVDGRLVRRTARPDDAGQVTDLPES